MEETLLDVKNLTVELGGRIVLEDITFSLRAGEIVVVIGPNGAGKSVMLRTLMGIHKHQGEIKWKKDVHVGLLPCDFTPPADLPVTVEDFFSFRGIPGDGVKDEYRKLNIRVSEDFLGKNISQLSTGQMRRTLIAWVLADNPDVVLLDEPFSHVDLSGREEIFKAFVELCKRRGMGIVLVSHDIGKGLRQADRVLAINKKTILYEKPLIALQPKNLIRIYASDLI